MRKVLFVFLIFISFSSFAQRSEFGLFGGGSYYIGDLNPKAHFLLTKPAVGIIYRYNFDPRFAFKGNAYFGSVAGDDAVSKYNVKRNLSFTSTISEFSAQLEFNFFPFITGNEKYPFSPYVFAGVSLFRFNPKAELKDDIVNGNGKIVYHKGIYELQPLGTEGQGTSAYPDRKAYSLTKFAIPFGVGIKYNLFKKVSIGLEYGLRRTQTDYLDDVSTTYADPTVLSSENTPVASALADKTVPVTGQVVNNKDLQRGNSKNKDWYSFFGVSIVFRLKFGNETCPAYGKQKNYKEYRNKY
ncbi:MAG: DUF6089 family protein [Bacteroidota bacterium]